MGANGGGCLGRTMEALFTGCVYSSLFFSSSKSVIWGGGTSWSLPMWDQSFPELSELWAIIHIYTCLFLELLLILSHFGCSWADTWTRNLSAKHCTNANQNDISPRRFQPPEKAATEKILKRWTSPRLILCKQRRAPQVRSSLEFEAPLLSQWAKTMHLDVSEELAVRPTAPYFQ